MRRTVTAVIATALLGVVFAVGWAVAPTRAGKGGIKQYIALMNGGQQNPAVTTAATGIAHFTFDPAEKQLCFDATLSDLPEIVTFAHVHRGAPGVEQTPGENVFGFPATPPYNNICGGTGGGANQLTKSDISLLNKGEMYINFHTAGNTAGHVRGQILLTK